MMTIALKVRGVLFLFLAAIWTVFISSAVILAALVAPSFAKTLERWWAKVLCLIFGIRLRVHGLEFLRAAPAFVLAPNHQSIFDIIVISTLPIDFRYLSKREIAYIPFLGWAVKAMGNYWVKRDRSPADLAVMKQVEDGLKAGNSVLIFPEGTRSRSGELLPFKKGAFKTASNAGVPVLPIAISGTFGIAPPGTLPYQRGFDVILRVSRPFPTRPPSPLDKLMGEFRQEIVSLLATNEMELKQLLEAKNSS